METKHGRQVGRILRCFLAEANIFGNCLFHGCLTIAVTYFIAETGANAELLRHLGQDRQATCRFTIGRVVVKNGSNAIFDARHVGRYGAGPHVITF